jgi:hypothetical protein
MFIVHTTGLRAMIVNYSARGIIYDHNMLIVQDTVEKWQVDQITQRLFSALDSLEANQKYF